MLLLVQLLARIAQPVDMAQALTPSAQDLAQSAITH
jgi:hypothetical protein